MEVNVKLYNALFNYRDLNMHTLYTAVYVNCIYIIVNLLICTLCYAHLLTFVMSAFLSQLRASV